MTRTEFNAVFWPDFRTRWPNDAAWIAGHEDTYRLWFNEVFSALGLMDCMEASRGIMGGKYPGWQGTDGGIYDRQSIPAVYSRVVGGMRRKRREEQEKKNTLREEQFRRQHNQGIVNSDPCMRKTLVECQRMKRGGATEKEIREYLDEVFA